MGSAITHSCRLHRNCRLYLRVLNVFILLLSCHITTCFLSDYNAFTIVCVPYKRRNSMTGRRVLQRWLLPVMGTLELHQHRPEGMSGYS